MIVSLANQVLSVSADSAAPSGFLSREDLDGVWTKIIDASPDPWSWYKHVYGSEVVVGSFVSGGKEFLECGVLEGDDDVRESWFDGEEESDFDRRDSDGEEDDGDRRED